MKLNLAHISGLAKVDVDVGDLVVLEKSEDILSCAVGSHRGGSVGGDANPDSDGTDNRLSLALFVVVLDIFVLDNLLKTNDVDRCKTNLKCLISKFYKDSDDNNSSDGGSGSDGSRNGRDDDDDNIDFNEPDEHP